MVIVMKIKVLFATVALVALASCSTDEMIGVTTPQNSSPSDVSNAIAFSSTSKGITRADFYGKAAAEKLGYKFVVYGTKHSSAEDNTAANDALVYNNFQVAWTANTAATTASNSSDWEYVGLQAYDATPTSQGIKYWDYSAAYGYTFYAFSSSDISYPAAASDKVSVTKTTSDGTSLYNKGYSVTVKNGANLNNLYFSERVPVAKADYDKTVDFTFRNIGAKVRVGFYETIPGYSVKIDKFYIDEDATGVVTTFPAMNVGKTDGFYASLQNVKRTVDQTLNVTYYDATTPTQVINRPKMTNPSEGYDYSLKLGNGSGIINKTLATSAATPTWVAGRTADNFYIPVFPNEGNTNPLLLKLDFTMTADDGSADVIHVRGARAIVPAQYVQWKSNFAYTYLFKISDKSNGTTGAVDENGDPITDPEGLKPITFDAIVVDVTNELQQTITSVSTNTITTYAEGAITDEYTTGQAIYTVITNNSTHAVITPSGIGNTAGKADVYKLNKAATESEVLGQLTGSPMGITLTTQSPTIGTTVPLTDGTTPAISNVMFTPSTAGTYAYVYTTTAYVAPTYEIQSSGTYDSSKTYYMKSGDGVYFTVTVPTEAAFNDNKSQLYLQTATGTPGVYDVKVIKVQ